MTGPQQHLGEAEDQQDRRDVEQQDVLDHVHHQQLVAEDVDRRDERREDREQPAREQRQAPVARRVRLTGVRAPGASREVEAAGAEHADQDSGLK